MRRPWRSALFFLGIYVALAELLARLLSPYAEIPQAQAAVRNPAMTRGWPEYTAAPPDSEPKPLVVLLTHSQGVGRELDDSSLIYPALVRQSLGSRVSFESWACGGLRTAEAEALLLRATQRRAFLVVLALAPTNLDPPGKLSLRATGTDAPLVAFDLPSLFKATDTASWSETSTNDLLVIGGRRASALLRSRLSLEDTIVPQLPLALAPFVAGQRIAPVERLDNLALSRSPYWGPLDEALGAFRAEQRSKGRLVRSYSAEQLDARLETLQELATSTVALTKGSGARLLWVWTPFDPTRVARDTNPQLERFFTEADEILERQGIAAVDLHNAIAADRFLTAAHLDARGHELLAGLMAEAIDHGLR